ncbi:MAG: ribonuclease P protein component [Planctomycetota bacterium]
MNDARLTFPRTNRLAGVKAFRRVFDEGRQVRRGPLTLYVLPNDLGHPRLGLTVSRRVGLAHERVQLKRLLREAYRHERHQLPAVDIVVVPRRHRLWSLDDYRRRLVEMTRKVTDAGDDRR